ncbi:MAG: hypothetical protein N2423_09975 [Novosphingobium sp.]|nr:hypothetical protein [Novosphingobium sp.]
MLNLRAGLLLIAAGLALAPAMLGFASDEVAAASALILSGLYGLLAAFEPKIGRSSLGTLLLSVGLWTMLAPGFLAFDLSNPAAFWAHTIAGFAGLRGSFVAFRDSDPDGMRAS